MLARHKINQTVRQYISQESNIGNFQWIVSLSNEIFRQTDNIIVIGNLKLTPIQYFRDKSEVFWMQTCFCTLRK